MPPPFAGIGPSREPVAFDAMTSLTPIVRTALSEVRDGMALTKATAPLDIGLALIPQTIQRSCPVSGWQEINFPLVVAAVPAETPIKLNSADAYRSVN